MEKLRISEKNKILQEIKTLEISNDRDNNTYHTNLTQSSQDQIYQNKDSVDKRKCNVEERKNKIEELKKRLILLSSGELDKSLSNSVTDYSNSLRAQAQKKAVIKQDIASKVKADITLRQKTERESISNNRGPSNYDYRRGYDFFVRSESKLPNYIRNNLDTMEGNKGYIFNDIYFMGACPPIKGADMILFDKKDYETLHIHEISSTHHKIYEKRGREKKYLLSSKPRIKKAHRGFSSFSSMFASVLQPKPVEVVQSNFQTETGYRNSYRSNDNRSNDNRSNDNRSNDNRSNDNRSNSGRGNYGYRGRGISVGNNDYNLRNRNDNSSGDIHSASGRGGYSGRGRGYLNNNVRNYDNSDRGRGSRGSRGGRGSHGFRGGC